MNKLESKLFQLFLHYMPGSKRCWIGGTNDRYIIIEDEEAAYDLVKDCNTQYQALQALTNNSFRY